MSTMTNREARMNHEHCTAAERAIRRAHAVVSKLKDGPTRPWLIDSMLYELETIERQIRDEVRADYTVRKA